MASIRFAYSLACRLFDLLMSISAMIAMFVVDLVRIPYDYLAHSFGAVTVASVAVLKALKPEYRESYQTHGLSLDHRWR